jgi:soluble lytic murein transglycosylase-like protein
MINFLTYGQTTNVEAKRCYNIQKKQSQKSIIREQVYEISKRYEVDPNLILSIIYYESDFDPKSKNTNCVGLMQIYKRWHMDRAKKLGIKDFYNTYNNITLGVDYIVELKKKYKDDRLVLMLYNMNNKTAKKLFKQGKISKYAKNVLQRKEYYKQGGII